MRFILDEHVSPIICEALSVLGHDAVLVSETTPGISDREIVLLAIKDDRIVVTEDKDFGTLAFRDGSWPPALVRIAMPGYRTAAKCTRLLALLAQDEIELAGAVTTIEPARTRRSAFSFGS